MVNVRMNYFLLKSHVGNRPVGRKYLGGVNKLEKKGPIRGCKTEIAIFTSHQILCLKCLTFVGAVRKIFSLHVYNQLGLHGEY